MVPQDLDALDLRLSAGLVLVEEVAPQEDHVHLLLHPDTEQLVKRLEAVVSLDGILLSVAQVDVTRDEDPEHVAFSLAGHDGGYTFTRA